MSMFAVRWGNSSPSLKGGVSLPCKQRGFFDELCNLDAQLRTESSGQEIHKARKAVLRVADLLDSYQPDCRTAVVRGAS
jgi:hypothetical protein